MPDIKLDSATNAQTVITYPHHEIHGGSAYFVSYSRLAADAEMIELRIKTPDTTKWAHMVIEIDAALAAVAELWIDTIKSDAFGNRLGIMNRDHNSPNTSGLVICHTPGGVQPTNANWKQYLGSASGNGKVVSGGGASSRHEFILKQNTAYLIRVTSRANSNSLTVLLDWYEHQNAG